jgi:hypothetical protein
MLCLYCVVGSKLFKDLLDLSFNYVDEAMYLMIFF